MAKHGRPGGDWRLTLQPGETEAAAKRLFVGRLGWRDEFLGASDGIRVVGGEPEIGEIGVGGDNDHLRLLWNPGAYLTIFTIDRDHPSHQQIRLLERLVRDETVEDSEAVVNGVFDADRLSLDFSLGAAEIVQRQAKENAVFLVQVGLRLIFLKMIEARGWARFRVRGGYVRELWEDQKKRPEPYSFTQRLALIWESAMRQAEPESRTLLQRLIGHPPYLGPELLLPLADPDHPPTEPNAAFFEDFFGWLEQFDFCLSEPSADRAELAVAPDSLARFAAAALDRTPPRSAREMRRAANQAVATSGRDSSLIHAVEIPAGWGCHLTAMLAAMSGKDDPRRFLPMQIRGVTEDAVEATVCRLRLLGVCLARDTEEAPVPVRGLDFAIRIGFALSPDHLLMTEADNFIPAESPSVEHRPWLEQADAESLLRSIAGFLNASGGMILMGLDEAGAIQPLDAGLEDVTEWVTSAAAQRLSPPPGPLMRVRDFEHEDGPLLRIEITPSYQATALRIRHPKTGEITEQIFVRQVNVHRELTGQAKERFVRERK